MSGYEKYLDGYAQTYRVTKEVAETHAIVKVVKEYYTEESEQDGK